MPKSTLVSVGFYMLAIAAGILLSKPLAVVLAALGTLVLLLVAASAKVVQRHFPDLGRLPLVEDHGYHERLRDHAAMRPLRDTPAEAVAIDRRPAMSRAIGQLANAATYSRHQRMERLESLYFEGEQLRASILLSSTSIVGDLAQGTANQRQIERERLAREWDGRVLADLPDDVRPKWIAAALPERSLEPASTIAGVRDFLATKLVCLKEIVGQLKAEQ